MNIHSTSRLRRGWALPALMACCLVAMGALAPASAAAAAGWRPAGCPALGGPGQGPSSLKVTGPCAFEYKGEADCEAVGDDLLVTLTRPAKGGAELMFHVNVERYVGPGKYKPPNDVFVSLKDGSKIYRWWTNEYEVTVGPKSKFVTLRNVQLEPELVLVGCTGPQTNYQCDGRGDEPDHMGTLSSATGTIYCKPGNAQR
jgi:hypothetical protein